MMKKEGMILTNIPHNSHSKRSIVAAKLEDGKVVRVFVKGAPEILVTKCSKTFDTENKLIFLSEDEQNYITQNIMERQLCNKGYRTLLYAFKDYPIEIFERMQRDWNNFRTEDERNILVQDLTFIGLFGLKDELRENVQASLMFARWNHIPVRMISGDAVTTAKEMAIEAGIMKRESEKKQYVVMHAEDFRKLVGKLVPDPANENELIVQNISAFKKIMTKLRVLARATPEDKHLIVQGLKEIGERVAVTGDGCNDAKALSAASVGISMGQEGCEVAKDASHVILQNDSFGHVMAFIMQGRNLYFNIRKFLQFQITVNVACLGTVVLTTLAFGQSPFNVF
jgi:Ca2+ transporting ATPase